MEFEKTTQFLIKKDCKPKQNILFLKTHKTGSSTIQNIFLRYGDKHDLTFALPYKSNYFGHPQVFHRRMLRPHSYFWSRMESLISPSYNIFTHHARFNYEEMSSVMPNDTIFVTILRQPVCSLQSLLSYIHLEKFYNETSLARSMERYFSNSSSNSVYHVLSEKRFSNRYGRNQMSFDLGLDPEDFDDSEIIKQFIREIDSQFHLVMITERMQESLILLQDLLCWSQEDMIVFEHNVRNVDLSCNLTGDMASTIRHHNAADQILYDFFRTKFDRQVIEFGVRRMNNEIRRLQSVTQLMYKDCVKGKLPIKEIISSKKIWYNDLVTGFEKNANVSKTCIDLTMYGLSYTDYIRNKQRYKIQNTFMLKKTSY
ncbi:hypothetical protein I4U23_015456 [Adineta vaga]|nr:hypothetical protein I4U23_015456 [Adineta vaga]